MRGGGFGQTTISPSEFLGSAWRPKGYTLTGPVYPPAPRKPVLLECNVHFCYEDTIIGLSYFMYLLRNYMLVSKALITIRMVEAVWTLHIEV